MSTKLTINSTIPIFAFCKNKNCLDIGANEGGMTVSMLNYGAKSVICFEPGKINANIMKNKFENDNRVKVYELGLSDEKKTLKNVTWLNAWVIGDPNEINLPISPGACDIEGYKLVDIELDTLDNIFKDHPEPIEFWKVDVDGYDFKVLKGGINLLNRDRPIIFIELSYYYDIIKGSSVKDFFKFVIDINYVFVSLEGKQLDIDFVKAEFPYNSSCDIFLCPTEKIGTFLGMY